ncbi:putative pumilio homolog 22 [Eutrema salsugineum]|nr:putative pumilio homolog 22 [Eutrema salsugineum]
MTHEHGKDLASRVLDVCNIHDKNMFCRITYHLIFYIAHNENGCSIIKKAITTADDLFKSDFLDLIAQHANLLSTHDLGISLFQHVVDLDFTKKTTEEDTRLHELMAEFDKILPITSDTAELHKLALKLTSDSDLFLELVKTKRGSLMAQIIIGKSKEIDTVFWEAIKQNYTNVATSFYGHHIFRRAINVVEETRKLKLVAQILRLDGYNALYLTKEPHIGNLVVEYTINRHDSVVTELVASGLQGHYIELSFLKHGSNIVAMLLGEDEELPLLLIVTEIVECDEDTLVRLANDEYGNGVLAKTLQVAKKLRDDLFGDLVGKLRPFLDTLRGSRGENIAQAINVLEERGKSRLFEITKRLNGYNALYLAKEPNLGLQDAIDLHEPDFTKLIACGLRGHFIELSFLKHGSNIVEKPLGEDEYLPLLLIIMEIDIKCDEDRLVRLAKDEYGNGVLKKTLQVAKNVSDDLFGYLVGKLRPLLDTLRGSRGENIAAIINELQ